MRRTEKKIYNASEVYRIGGSCFPELEFWGLKASSKQAQAKQEQNQSKINRRKD